MTTAPAVNHLLERAVVKVLINDTFKGSGFFISPDYVLTAYHCLNTLVDSQDIYVENQTYGRMRVLLEQEKSYPSQTIDIAVLKLVTIIEITDYLPLGLITERNFDNEILAVGYPSEDFQLVRGRIHGFHSKTYQFYTDVTKAKGQSGSPVYHFEMNRVVGIVLNIESNSRGGLAGRFDMLLRQWQELESLNQQAIDYWERRLNIVLENHKKLRKNNKSLEDRSFPEVDMLLRQAREFTEGKDAQGNSISIDFDKADALLAQALQLEQQDIVQLQDIIEKKQLSAAQIKRQQKEIQRNKEKVSGLSVEIIYQRAIIASIQFNNAKAIHHYRQLFSLPYITDFPHLDQLVSDYAASINLQIGNSSKYLPQYSTEVFDKHLGTVGRLSESNKHLSQYLMGVSDKHLQAATGVLSDSSKYLSQYSAGVLDKPLGAMNMLNNPNTYQHQTPLDSINKQFELLDLVDKISKPFRF